MTPILKNNIQIYFILVNIIILIIYSLTILIIVMSFRIKNKKLNILWPISILKFCLPFFSVCFFGQSFLLLTTIFDCQNGFTYVSQELICRTGIWFSIDAPLSAIAMVLHTIIALITNTLYYKSIFVKKGPDVLRKTNCYPDIILLMTKISVIVLFILDNGVEDEHWTILFFLILFTGINALCTFHFQNRKNKKLNFLNNIFSLMPFLGFFSLLIGKIFKFLGFNGSVFLFFSWIMLIIIFILLYKKKEMDFVVIDYKQIENPGEYINYLNRFYKLVTNKNNSRSYYTTLKSVISKNEEKCYDSHCPLKKYSNISDEIDDIFPLLLYCEKLFEYGIAKFPDNISLKINYSMFLIFEMNHNKKALIILNSIHMPIFSFQDNYNIYRCKRLIDSFILNKNKNVMHSFQHKKKIYDFRLLISKVTSLYYDFWTLIIINKLNYSNNVEELNKIGSEIIKLSKKIEEDYDLLIKVKSDNFDLIKLYSYFSENVLNGQEKNQNQDIEKSNTNNINNSDSYEIQFSNFDINTLKDKDLLKYFILSGKNKELANIIDFSLNLCPILGYNQSEIIGKNINYLIPELFHNSHNKLLINYNEKTKTTFYKELYNKDNYIPDYLHKSVYAMSKSKLLIPLKLKIYYVQTEKNEFIYIVEVTKIKDYAKNLEISEDSNLKCIVLTDENFYIQSFTPNCIRELKLNDSYINANYNIINYIKQLKDEYLKKINELNKIYSLNTTARNISCHDISDDRLNETLVGNISYKEKKKIRKELVDNKYLGIINEVTWKINVNNNEISNDRSIFQNSLFNFKEHNMKNSKCFFEEELTLQIKKIIMNKKLLGYYFIFQNDFKELIKKSNFLYNIVEQTDNRNNIVSKRKKYKYLFEINPIILRKNTKNLINDEKFPIQRCKSPKKIIKFKSYEKEEFFYCLNKINDINLNLNKKKNRSIKVICSTDIYNDDARDHITISDNYLPESSFNFEFDITNRYYKPVYYNKKENDINLLNETLKLQALNKINSYQEYLKNNKNNNYNQKIFNSFESDESDNESKESLSSSNIMDSNSHNSKDSNINSSIIKNNSSSQQKKSYENNIYLNNENNSEHQKIKQPLNKNDLLNNIYRVNLNKIVFSIYDFNKDMVVDVNVEKISKIDNIVKNTKQRLSVELKSLEDFSNIYSNYNEDKKRQSSSKNIHNSIKKEIITDDKIIENKIVEAINKEQDEDSISIIYKFSFVALFILIICSLIYLYFEINSYLDSKTLLNIIKDIISINYCNKFGLYFVRELTLLNVPNTGIEGGQYVIVPAKNRAEYKSMIREIFLELFMESQLSMVDYIGTSFSISKDSDLYLSTKLITKLSDSDLKSTIIKNNIIITIVQLNSAFYNLASSTSPVEQNHADLFNFIYNSLNNFKLAIDMLLDTYLKELDLKANSYTIIFQILIFVNLLIYIVIYVICIILYSNAIKRKKIYMKVFFNINYDFITSSINKCEEFINKFKLPEEMKLKEEEIDESNDEKVSLIQHEKHFKDPKSILKEKALNINNDKEKNRLKCSKNSVFKLILGLSFLILFLLYYLYGFLYFLNLNNRTRNITKYYYYLQKYHLNIMEYYNIFREYLFDNGSMILNVTPFESLSLKEKKIYIEWTDCVNNITYYESIFLNNEILERFNKTLCSYNITDYFNSTEECHNTVGNSYNEDIYTFLSGFFDELRIKKNIVKILLDLNIIIGNLTEYKTETWYNDYYHIFNEQSNDNLQTKVRFRLELFNDGYFHTISNIFFINIIFPFINEQRKAIFDFLSINKKQNVYYILITLFLILLLGIYMLYWIPIVRNLNRIIYETKNMLKIIPMHILIADVNIKNF